MSLGQLYEAAIWWVVNRSGGSDKFAHTYVGLAIWLSVFLMLRRRHASLVALLVVIVAEIANECVDRLTHHSWRWRDTLGDMAASWFWPAVLTFVERRRSSSAAVGS